MFCVLCLVTQSHLTLCNPVDCSPAGFSVHGDSPGKNSGGGLPNPGIEPKSPTLQVDSLPSEPPGKPKNTRVGSLSLLQGIFLAQELNLGLLHCRWILYQLSYQGSPLCSQQHYSQQLKQPKCPSAGGWIQMREMHVSAQFSRSVVSHPL